MNFRLEVGNRILAYFSTERDKIAIACATKQLLLANVDTGVRFMAEIEPGKWQIADIAIGIR